MAICRAHGRRLAAPDPLQRGARGHVARHLGKARERPRRCGRRGARARTRDSHGRERVVAARASVHASSHPSRQAAEAWRRIIVTVPDEPTPQREPEALACRRRAFASEILCWRRALRWVYVVLALLVLAVILAATLR